MKRRRPYIAAGVVLLVVAVLAASAVLVSSSRVSLGSDANALAAIGLPTGGGKIENVTVTTGPHSAAVPFALRGDTIWPNELIPAHQAVSVDVTIKRPGWISWLSGSTQHVHLQLMTPVASLRAHYLTLRSGAPLRLHFRQPIQVISYGQPGALRRHVLATPSAVVTVPRGAAAGTLGVAAAPRTWESAKAALVSWFPAGAAASAVANPAPGTQIHPNTPISLTFNKTVQQVLGNNRPPVTPTTAGTWHTVSSHMIVFKPEAYGYGLGTSVHVSLPSGVSVVGGTGGDPSWSVPGGSTLRLQQLLAILGYLPLKFSYTGPGVKPTPAGRAERGDPCAGWQVHLELSEHALRAHRDVAARCGGRDDPGRADGVRGRQWPGDRRTVQPARVEVPDPGRPGGEDLDLRLYVRVGQRGQPRDRADVAQRQDRRLRRRQHGHPSCADGDRAPSRCSSTRCR